MKWFYVACELQDDERHYGDLRDELSEREAIRVLPSVWYLRAGRKESAQCIANSLKRHLHSDDRLLVIETIDCSWANLMANPLTLQFARRSGSKESLPRTG
jgi:hypothetical protein